MEGHHPRVVPGRHLDAAPRQEALADAGRDSQLEQAAESDQRHENGVDDPGVVHHWSSTSSEQKPGPMASNTP